MRIVRDEAFIVVFGLLAALATVLLLASHIADFVTGRHFELGFAAPLAASANGAAKLATNLPRAVVTACGTQQDLNGMNRLSWVNVAAVGLGGVLGANAGLVGVMSGAALGGVGVEHSDLAAGVELAAPAVQSCDSPAK